MRHLSNRRNPLSMVKTIDCGFKIVVMHFFTGINFLPHDVHKIHNRPVLFSGQFTFIDESINSRVVKKQLNLKLQQINSFLYG